MENGFKALLITQRDGTFASEVKDIDIQELPKNDLLIKVSYSSLNYKDALSASGNKGVTKKFPHVPGIDAAGIIVQSNSEDFKEGDQVIVTGFDMGMNTWGGFGQYISVPAAWAIALPAGLTLREAMIFGTAGLTAGLSIDKIVSAGITSGNVVISGATGGVGSMATAIMAELGFEVTAISGKNEDEFLKSVLGAKHIFDRAEFVERYNSKHLSQADFNAGIDNVGGPILSGILKSLRQNGIATCCGNVASADLNTSVFPFILRGVTLCGIDSAQADIDWRKKVWNALSTNWKPSYLQEMAEEIGVNQLDGKLTSMLQGKAKGRYILNHEQ